MPTREVILNLWYVRDEAGIIYSLRAKAYVAAGTYEDKLRFLQERAQHDYLIAQPFNVPERFHMMIGTSPGGRKMPVGHVAMLQSIVDTPIALFEDAIGAIESGFPSQSNLRISDDPLTCVTPLMQNTAGVIEPRITGQARY